MADNKRSFFSRVARHSVKLAAVLLVLGSILRLTIRDNIVPLSMIYYATPVFVLAALAVFVALGVAAGWVAPPERFRDSTKSATRWATVAGCMVAAGAWTVFGFQTEMVAGAPPSSASDPANGATTAPDELRVMLWNVRHGDSGWEGVEAQLAETGPDIFAAVEISSDWHLEHAAAALGSQHHPGPLYHGMGIVSRGTIDEVEDGRLANGYYHSARVTLDGEPYRVIVVDMKSTPWLSRKPAFNALAELVEKFQQERLLVMGDFNTPYDSVHSETLASTLTHAFRTHGSGYSATWPFPLPVLELDHVWFNDQVTVRDCKHVSSINSDHRAVEFLCAPRN